MQYVTAFRGILWLLAQPSINDDEIVSVWLTMHAWMHGMFHFGYQKGYYNSRLRRRRQVCWLSYVVVFGRTGTYWRCSGIFLLLPLREERNRTILSRIRRNENLL